ncbi:uncharacterized protein LOC114414954 [Glycine soja]|uniref:uncharacterized protein n=1 Tax=Glycine max TaxID=3847 RepID=UPI0003DEAD37|nr:uncharacterized protein LOC102663702 [Glycine max]XP_028235255.1 uncharacterized protein LOC114414954 [Glycine soja]|eukprot:XP_006574063.1 uncharacterized protein LOC102663702 [Glycine max]
MGCVLGQHDESGKRERAIYYLSKKFIACEMNYSLLERTCDPIKYIFENPALTRRIARWQVLLSEFDIINVTQKAIKGSALADYLDQQPINDYQPMHPEFLDEDMIALFKEEVEYEDRVKWVMWFDVEYEACALRIRAVVNFRVKLLKVYRDSTLMADALATLSSMFKEEDGKPWYFDIKRYIKDKEYRPEASDNDKRTL